jgi:hypothetical protein
LNLQGMNMNAQTIDTDDRDCLSEFHRGFLTRYIEFELRRQERVSERFLRERSRPTASDSESKYQIS